MSKHRRSHNQKEKGGTLVEFLFIAILLLGIVGFLIDVGMAYFHYHLLVHTSASTVRRLAVDVQGASDSASLNSRAAAVAGDYYQNAFGIRMPPANFNTRIENTSDGACLLRLEARLDFRCFFCVLFQGPFQLKTEAESLIEDECYVCS